MTRFAAFLCLLVAACGPEESDYRVIRYEDYAVPCERPKSVYADDTGLVFVCRNPHAHVGH